MSSSPANPSSNIALSSRLKTGEPRESLPVPISYEIIQLFSEGLYRSPHKAIEELVTNSFDAGARRVSVLMPRTGDDSPPLEDSLWTVDDGCGMDAEGFRALWRVGESPKINSAPIRGRQPIGQFGIGKLAAYVLAWRLTHVSKQNGQYSYVSMDFHDLEGRRLYGQNSQPVFVGRYELSEADAKHLLSEIAERDSATWEWLFGPESTPSWTAAALSEFRDLFGRLREGTLRWVLRTSLPLTSDFAVSLNGEVLSSSKIDYPIIVESKIGGPDDSEAREASLETTEDGVLIPGIEGPVRGIARIYERPLTEGKSQAIGRSNGFFVRVRGRVINLEDDLFGIGALNHAAWAHFVMEVDADGLRDHLLSSREAVRDSTPIWILRDYLHKKFNVCRSAYDRQAKAKLVGIDIETLLRDAPSALVVEPVIRAVRDEVGTESRHLYYIKVPEAIPDADKQEWLAAFEDEFKGQAFSSLKVESANAYGPLGQYDASTRSLWINKEHPFISKMNAHAKNQTPIALFTSAEIITDALLREYGLSPESATAFFDRRDRALRALAGDYGPDAKQVLRQLQIANQDENAMEKAVGFAFQVLGFGYEPRGGRRPGVDGVLTAHLGKRGQEDATYRVVYDAKTTDRPSVPADKCDFAKIRSFLKEESARYAFFIAKGYDGQSDEGAKVNTLAREQQVTVLTLDHLRKIILLHYRYGVTLTQLELLFEEAYTVSQVTDWLARFERTLQAPDARVPLGLMLNALEKAKADSKSVPNLRAVREHHDQLKAFDPEKLISVLEALQNIISPTWIEVERRSGNVTLHQTADQVIAELTRRLSDLGLPSDLEG